MTTDPLLERIADGRTDLVWDYVAQGHPATAETGDGRRLLEWAAHYGDVSALRFLLEHGESLQSLGNNFGLAGAAFHGAHFGHREQAFRDREHPFRAS